MSEIERIINSIGAAKKGIAEVIGQERAEAFIGRNIEILLTALYEDKSEAEAFALCDYKALS